MNQERWHLKRFVEICSDFPLGEIVFQDKPDLLVLTEQEIIGIEHTQLINNEENGLKAQEVLENRIVKKAKEIFENDKDIPIYVYVYFQPGTNLHKRKVSDISQALAALVLNYLPEKGNDANIECWRLPYTFPSEINHVYIFWFEKATYPLWAVSMAGMVPHLTKEIIANRIQRKEKLLESYLKVCDEVWLLIVLDGFTPAGNWDVDTDVLGAEYMSNFKRVILYNHFTSKYKDLILSCT